jgi:dTMP kinase
VSGFYVIFEGGDGAGKSSTMKAVAAEVKNRLKEYNTSFALHMTHHPGSTPLGAHMRKLVKFSEEIDPNITIDNLSRQLLYMVDTVSFVNQILRPALAADEWVFADRSSFISALVYGVADGLNLEEIDHLFQIITPPKANRLYVLQCPWTVGAERLRQRAVLDHFDRKPPEFFEKVEDIYNNLLTGSAERTMLVSKSVALQDVIYVDSTLPFAQVVNYITADLLQEAQNLAILPPK